MRAENENGRASTRLPGQALAPGLPAVASSGTPSPPSGLPRQAAVSPSPTATAAPRRLGELDALRGLAALAVVLFHYTYRFYELHPLAPTLPFQLRWGAHGVDLFFAISGFVILMTLHRCKRPSDFLVSRFVRLYPAYWVALVTTFCVVSIWSLPGRSVTLGQALVNLTMNQDLLNVPHVDGVYWSLQIELIFYAWMFALFCLGRLSAIRHVAGAWMLLAIVVASVSFVLGRQSPPYLLSKGLLLPYSGMFSVGIVAFLAMGRAGIDRFDVALWLLAVCVAGLWGDTGSVVACLVSIGIFWLFLTQRLRWLAWKPLCGLGVISYTWYLLHQNIGYVIMRESMAAGMAPLVAAAGAMAVSLLLATALTYGIERPAMRLHRRLSGKRPAAPSPA